MEIVGSLLSLYALTEIGEASDHDEPPTTINTTICVR